METVILRNYDEFITFFNSYDNFSYINYPEGLILDIQGDIDFSGKPIFNKYINPPNKGFKLFSSNGSKLKNMIGTVNSSLYIFLNIVTENNTGNSDSVIEISDLTFENFDITCSGGVQLFTFKSYRTQLFKMHNVLISCRILSSNCTLILNDISGSSVLNRTDFKNIIFNIDIDTQGSFYGIYNTRDGSSNVFDNIHFYGKFRNKDYTNNFIYGSNSLIVNSGVRLTMEYNSTSSLRTGFIFYGSKCYNIYVDLILNTTLGNVILDLGNRNINYGLFTFNFIDVSKFHINETNFLNNSRDTLIAVMNFDTVSNSRGTDNVYMNDVSNSYFFTNYNDLVINRAFYSSTLNFPID